MPMKPLQKGEYDIASIALIRFDPVTGRSFEECQNEFKGELAKVAEQVKKLRWW